MPGYHLICTELFTVFSICSHLRHSITHMSNSPMPILPSHPRSAIIQNSIHFSKIAKGQLMVPISTHLFLTMQSLAIVIEKAVFHRMSWLLARKTCGSHIFSVDGRGVHQMAIFTKMLGETTSQYLLESTSLPMRGFLFAVHCWCHIEGSVTTLKNGAKFRYSESFFQQFN
jgi:hypothetical protein